MRCNGIEGCVGKRANDSKVTDESTAPIVGGTKYHIFATPVVGTETEETGVQNFKQTRAFRKKSTRSVFAVSPVAEDFLRWQPKEEADDLFLQKKGGDAFWELRTEVSVVLPDDIQRTMLRCHPNYRNEGPWFDWVVVNFDRTGVIHHRNTASSKRAFTRSGGRMSEFDPIEGTTQYPDGCIPCKVLAVAENPKDPTDVRLLVHGCNHRTENRHTQFDTVLLEFWQLAHLDLHNDLPKKWRDGSSNVGRRPVRHQPPHLTWVSTQNVVSRCLAIEETPGIFESLPLNEKGNEMNWVMLIRQHNLWPEQFTTTC